MAYQIGDIKFKGQLGDLTFYKQGDSYLAKRKGGISPKRMATDPKLERSRENSSEFGRASTAAKQLRRAMREVLPLFHEGTMQTRLNKRILQLIKGDGTSDRGKRRLIPVNLPLLIGFSFNSNSSWKDVYYAPFQRSFDERSGKLLVTFPEHWAAATLLLPKLATGVRFTVAALTADTKNETFHCCYEHSPVLPASGLLPQQRFELDAGMTGLPVILATGLAFFKEVGGYQVPIEKPLCNALDIIDVFQSYDLPAVV